MSLDEFGQTFSQEAIEEFGTKLLNQYGEEVCEAASVIEGQNLSKDSVRSYKPQIRQILYACSDMNPTPRDVADHISDADKSSGTKSLMVSAIERYFKSIGEPQKGEKVRTITNNEGITEKDFNTESTISGWITKDEMLRIEDKIFPENSEQINRLSFVDQSWVITLEHKALAMTLFYTACRVGEICKKDSDDHGILVEDIYSESDEMNLYRLKKKGKGYKRDMTAVPGKLIDVLQEYLETNNIQEGEVFPFTTRTAQSKIKEIGKVYKHAFGDFEHMDKLTPHKFRHGRITDIANTSGLEEAGQYVDHASPETTDQYRHITTEEQRDALPEESGSADGQEIEKLMQELDVDSVEEAIEAVSGD